MLPLGAACRRVDDCRRRAPGCCKGVSLPSLALSLALLPSVAEDVCSRAPVPASSFGRGEDLHNGVAAGSCLPSDPSFIAIYLSQGRSAVRYRA